MGKGREFFVIAHNIRSLYNVGSVFRTADAFGVGKIFLTGYTGTPANPIHLRKISNVALGAEMWIPWERSATAFGAIRMLRKQHPGIIIIGLDNNVPEGTAAKGVQFLNKFKPQFPLALILGEEVRGIARPLLKACDVILEIPMLGKKESLNVSVAFGIAAYALSAGRTKK